MKFIVATIFSIAGVISFACQLPDPLVQRSFIPGVRRRRGEHPQGEIKKVAPGGIKTYFFNKAR